MEEEYWAKKTCSIQLSIVGTQENIEDTWCSNYTDIVFFLFLIDDFDLNYIYMGEARLKSRKKRELPLVLFLHKIADCLIYSILLFHTLRYSLNTTSVRIEVNCLLYHLKMLSYLWVCALANPSALK